MQNYLWSSMLLNISLYSKHGLPNWKILTFLSDNFCFYQLHRELAREAVRKSLVLLKNGKHLEKPFLPLDKNAEKILVTGTHADDLGYQCGGWTKSWDGQSGRVTIGKFSLIYSNHTNINDKCVLSYSPSWCIKLGIMALG